MKVKGGCKKERIEGKREIEIGVDLMCNYLIKRGSISPKKRLKSQPGSDFGDESLDDEAAKQSEWKTTVENGEVKGIHDIFESLELAVRIISSYSQELHMICYDGDLLSNNMNRKHVRRVNRRHRGERRRRVRSVEEQQEGFRPRSKPTVSCLKALSMEDEMFKKGKRSSEDGRVIHGFDHGDRQLDVIRRSVRGGVTRMVCRENK
jgi:hypothetical protein